MGGDIQLPCLRVAFRVERWGGGRTERRTLSAPLTAGDRSPPHREDRRRRGRLYL